MDFQTRTRRSCYPSAAAHNGHSNNNNSHHNGSHAASAAAAATGKHAMNLTSNHVPAAPAAAVAAGSSTPQQKQRRFPLGACVDNRANVAHHHHQQQKQQHHAGSVRKTSVVAVAVPPATPATPVTPAVTPIALATPPKQQPPVVPSLRLFETRAPPAAAAAAAGQQKQQKQREQHRGSSNNSSNDSSFGAELERTPPQTPLKGGSGGGSSGSNSTGNKSRGRTQNQAYLLAQMATPAEIADYEMPECGTQEYELVAHKVAQREKQLNLGRQTDGYLNYIAMVPHRDASNPDHINTPRATWNISKRQFDLHIRQWRRELHGWDKKNSGGDKKRKEAAAATAAAAAAAAAASATAAAAEAAVVPAAGEGYRSSARVCLDLSLESSSDCITDEQHTLDQTPESMLFDEMPGLEPIPELLPILPRLCADAVDVPADAAAASTTAKEEVAAAAEGGEAETEDAPAASEIGEQPEDFGGSFANDADIASFVGDERPSGCYDEEELWYLLPSFSFA